MGASTGRRASFGYGAMSNSLSIKDRRACDPVPSCVESVVSYIWCVASVSRQTLAISALSEQMEARDREMATMETSENKQDRETSRAVHWLQLISPSNTTLHAVAHQLNLPQGLIQSDVLLVAGGDACMQFSVKMHGLDEQSQFFEERLRVFLLRNSCYIITIQESDRLEPLLQDVYHKIATQHSRLRKCGDPSFMVYEVIDAAIDYTFDLVLTYEDSILDMERDLLLEDQNIDRTPIALLLKRTLCIIRINMWRIRELLMELRSDEYGCISAETQTYLLQATDHSEHIVELTSATIDSVKEVEGLIRQGRQARADSTLMTLTSVSLFLLPAQFITGLYGMNFDNMPELHWQNGYFLCLTSIVGLFIVVACYLLYFSRRTEPILKDSSARRSYARQDYIQRQHTQVVPDVFQLRKRMSSNSRHSDSRVSF